MIRIPPNKESQILNCEKKNIDATIAKLPIKSLTKRFVIEMFVFIEYSNLGVEPDFDDRLQHAPRSAKPQT